MRETTIRALEDSDAPSAAQIFFWAVREGTKAEYSPEQRSTWAGDEVAPERWRERLAGQVGFVAEQQGVPVGFMTIDATGYIDFAFVLPTAAGTGVGKLLYQAVEQKAQKLGAKPFFEGRG